MSRFFINRPVTAMVISILIVLAGIVVASRLPVAQFPQISLPEIVVKTNFVGADAETIESSVATPIEEVMAGVEGMSYMARFKAKDGTMKLRIDFDLSIDPNMAEVFSEIRLNRPLPQLPPAVRAQGVTIAKSHVAPVMIIALSPPKGSWDTKFLANYANINLGDPLTRVSGIGAVLVQGNGALAMRNWVKPDCLTSLGVTVPDLVKAIEQQNSVNRGDMDYTVSLDTTLSVREGIREIATTLWQALILVILVVFVFLQSFRATLIPTLTVPVSLIGTFIFFPMLGFSISSLSLFGLVLAIGLVVNDSIVVVEAIGTHIAQGLSPKEASLKAMSEIAGPETAIALTLAAVFVPTAFIPGIMGRLYQQFAFTIAISVLISAFNAFSLSPALCSLLLKLGHASGTTWMHRVFGGFNRNFERATNRYVSLCAALITFYFVESMWEKFRSRGKKS